MEKKRIHSVKTRIKDINNGRYVAQEGFNPNYVLTKFGLRLSRVRILATVVDKFISESGKFAAITLDDGTDTVRAKVFSTQVPMFESIAVGSEIDLIGRLKEYQGEVFIAPEIITAVSDNNFHLLRELELRHQDRETEQKRKIILENQKQTADMAELERVMRERHGIQPEEVEAMLQVQEEPAEDGKKDEVLKLIEKLDSGAGCDYAELIAASGMPEDVIDSIVNELLSDGVCFEPRPGKIKKL
ncbi:MAG: hypothetical protein HY517_04700 [Candidatus Aenigmarchaeota archaeon]|nr:hypothetical protein [Candidatus Aenigmarchaeota archaeon]